MAYRFLLSVPTTLVDDANIAVAEAGDAQVLVVRNAADLGFEAPFSDLTVAAHSLRVVSAVYDWYEAMGPDRPTVGLVLHGGARLLLSDHDRGAMVAAIRRDQPWVERTIPHIGQHSRDEPRTPLYAATTAAAPAEGVLVSSVASSALAGLADASTVATAPLNPAGGLLAAEPLVPRSIAIRDVDHIAVRVTELARAEAFYVNFFGMEVVGRGRRSHADRETIDLVGPDDQAAAEGREIDVSFLRNGPLVLAVHRVGRGARIERDPRDRVSIRVEPATFRQLKGEALMRSMEILSDSDRATVLRDPFGLTWEISVDTSPEALA